MLDTKIFLFGKTKPEVFFDGWSRTYEITLTCKDKESKGEREISLDGFSEEELEELTKAIKEEIERVCV